MLPTKRIFGLVIGTRNIAILAAIRRPTNVNLVNQYLRLSKHKLNGFIVFTTFVGYCLHPNSFDGIGWQTQLSALLLGTAGCSFSAAAFNQIMEVPYDLQMTRTCTRPLPARMLPLRNCLNYAILSGVFGTLTLLVGTNPLTALLGLTNIVLYSLIYTPMKRKSPFNTWIGAFVGAIPALMGWTGISNIEIGYNYSIYSLLFPALIFSWQFPHFLSLGWRLRSDYARAGFVMLPIMDGTKTKRVIVRYTLAIPIICGLFYSFHLVDWTYLIDSSLVNLYLIQRTWKFYRNSTQDNARRLFLASLLHLPLLLMLTLGHHAKKQKQSKTQIEK